MSSTVNVFLFYKKMFRLFRIIFIYVIGLTIFSSFALADDWLGFLGGDMPQPGLLYNPYVYHIFETREQQTFNYTGGTDKNDKVQLFKINIQSIAAATFVNSYGDRSYYLGIQRVFWKNQHSSLNYSLGGVYGYDGKLGNKGTKLYKMFFQGTIDPYGDVEYQYNFNEHLSVVGLYALIVVGLGLKVSF